MSKVHHIDVRYSRSYATYGRAVKEAEAVISKLGLNSTVVIIAATGDKHDRFSPVFRLGQQEQFVMGALAHNGYNVV